jgi:hypothetical protein
MKSSKPNDAQVTDTTADKKKLVLERQTVRTMSVRTGMQTGWFGRSKPTCYEP